MPAAALPKGVQLKGKVVELRRPFPMMGHVAFGLLDRGLNLLQVRVTTLCPLACPFCSVDAGPTSRRRSELVVADPEWLASWFRYACQFKGKVHALFDAAGEPLTHPQLPAFVREIRETGCALSVTVETRLFPATEKLLAELAEAGVERLNVSIDTLNPEKAKALAGSPAYDLKRVLQLVELAHKELGLEVHVTPLWLPGVNDEDIEEIIAWALKLGLGGRVPPLGLQKYVAHKHGRKMTGVREVGWHEFYELLSKLEEKYNVKLILSPSDYGLQPAPRVPCPYKRGEPVKLYVVSEGPFPGEYLAVTPEYDRAFTLLAGRLKLSLGDVVASKVVEAGDCILLAKAL